MVVAGRKLAVQFMLPMLGQLEVDELWVINHQHAVLPSAQIPTRVYIIEEFDVAEVSQRQSVVISWWFLSVRQVEFPVTSRGILYLT